MIQRILKFVGVWVTRLGVVSSLLIALMISSTLVAAAHHPTITGTIACKSDGSIKVKGTSEAWEGTTGIPDTRVNHKVELYYSTDGGAHWTKFATGEYSAANNYKFDYELTLPVGTTGTVKLKAVAVPRWGANENRAEANTSSETLTLTVPKCTGTVKIVKKVVGGTANPGDASFSVGGKPAKHNEEVEVIPGTYNVFENPMPNYTAGAFTGDCKDGKVTVKAGEHKVCYITNTANPTEGEALACKGKDLNDNGMYDQGVEPLLPDWVIHTENGVIVKKTGPNGCVSFTLPYGNTSLCENLKDGWINTTPICQVAHVTQKPPETVYFMNRPKKGKFEVFKFNDADQSKDPGPNESGIDKVPFIIYKLGSTEEVTRTVTLANGHSPQIDLPEGKYTVCEIVPDGWTPTGPVCVDINIEDKKLTLINVGDFKPPTNLPEGAPPAQPSRLFIPNIFAPPPTN